MEDRELLELAAKAAGMSDWVWCSEHHAMCHFNKKMRSWYKDQNGDRIEWNPVDNDGDALRLTVKLGAVIGTYANFSTADLLSPNERIETVTVWHHTVGGDALVATRLAIVRAAAEVGKVMP